MNESILALGIIVALLAWLKYKPKEDKQIAELEQKKQAVQVQVDQLKADATTLKEKVTKEQSDLTEEQKTAVWKELLNDD